MAGASDKARFYLEQTVPELRELERKNLFSKAEIRSIAKKRSDFEHVLNARGSTPLDYAKYVEYETNLHQLCRRRAKRAGVKRWSSQGTKRIFAILDRATRRFPGDLSLWMQYLSVARGEKALKKASEILAAALRLHPTRPTLWIYAAKYAIQEKADMAEARGYMLRGLRFCKGNVELWVEYARLEGIYIAKISKRRMILGLEKEDLVRIQDKGDVVDPDAEPTDPDGLLQVAREDDGEGQERASKDESLAVQPDLGKITSGAIVKAVFDEAMKQFGNDPEAATRFFHMAAELDIPPRQDILRHILKNMESTASDSPETLLCSIQQPSIAMDPSSPDFPLALDSALDRLEIAFDRPALALPTSTFFNRVVGWLLAYADVEELDSEVRKVLLGTIRRIEAHCGRAVSPNILQKIEATT